MVHKMVSLNLHAVTPGKEMVLSRMTDSFSTQAAGTIDMLKLFENIYVSLKMPINQGRIARQTRT